MHSYRYPRPALTVDCVVFGFEDSKLNILLIRRGLAPYRGKWALPGGFVNVEESLDEAARRELMEETGLRDVFLEQLGAFGAVDRDPRERVVSVAYYALVKPQDHRTQASTDADAAEWFPLDAVPPLAFDHQSILVEAIERLRTKIRHRPIGFELLPDKFTLTMLQQLYEAVLDRALDKRNFRKKLLSFDLLIPLKEKHREGSHRPAQLYRFDQAKYQRLSRRGFHFEL